MVKFVEVSSGASDRREFEKLVARAQELASELVRKERENIAKLQKWIDASSARLQSAIEHVEGIPEDGSDRVEEARKAVIALEKMREDEAARQQRRKNVAPSSARSQTTTPSSSAPTTSPQSSPSASSTSTPVGAKGKAGKVFKAMWENVQS